MIPRSTWSSLEACRTGARRCRLSAALMAGVLAGCGADPTEPEDDGAVVRDIHELVEVNGLPLPAIAVQGVCTNILFPVLFQPDTIEIDGGRLTLTTAGSYEVYYLWHGKTYFCTTVGVHWHRLSAGDFAVVADSFLFLPDTARATSRPTHHRQNHWDPPTGTRQGSDILIDWGPLRLRYAPAASIQ